jgi:hypothetical protein
MKKIIKKRVIECVLEQQKIAEYVRSFPHDFDSRLSKVLKLRENYNDIIPITKEMEKDALDYIEALENENYEVCNNFLII